MSNKSKNKIYVIYIMPYKIVTRKNYKGYWVRKADGSKIIHNPNTPHLRRETKYTSKKPMTLKNAEKQVYFLNVILPLKKGSKN